MPDPHPLLAAPVDSRRRWVTAFLVNLIIPGTGLIWTRREWFGVLLALLFGICAQLAFAAVFFAPAAVPDSFATLAAVAAGVVWLVAQLALVRRVRWLTSNDARARFDLLLGDARRARDAGDIETARLAYRGALEINDEDLTANLEYARLIESADPAAARRVWRRVRDLDPRGQSAPEARQRAARSLR